VKAVTHIDAVKQAAMTAQEGLICAAHPGSSESRHLTEIKAAREGRTYGRGIRRLTQRSLPMPLMQTLFLAATVGAFTLFGVALAFCRAVSKDAAR
jgi:hypothetical protein